MDEKDASEWFVAKPDIKKHAETLVENFLEPATMEAVYKACGRILGDQPTTEKLNDVVRTAIETAENVWQDLAAESPAFECHKGCAWCCHQTVMVIAPEVLFVKKHIESTFAAAEIDDLKETLRQRSREILGKDTAARQTLGVACGLLKDSVCSAHGGRPLMCRGAHSESAQVCRALFDNFDGVVQEISSGERKGPFLFVPKMIFNSAQTGMVMALRDVGLECNSLELTSALEIALTTPNIEEEWLRDQSVFASARLTVVDDRYFTSGNGIVPEPSG